MEWGGKATPTSPGQPERGGGNFRFALEEARGGGGGCGPPPVGRGKWIRPGPFPRPGPTRSGSSGAGSLRERPDWAGGDTWAVAPRLRGGGGVRAPESGTRSGARDALHAQKPGSPARRGDTGFPAAKAGGCARGCRRAQPGDPLPDHHEEGGRRPSPRKRDVPCAARVRGREEGCLGHACCKGR